MRLPGDVFQNFLNKEVELVTSYAFICTGIFKLNDSLVYDECKYVVEDGNTKYYFNAEEIAGISIITEEDK